MKKNIKKYFSIMLGMAVMAAMLTACKGKTDDETAGDKTTTAPTGTEQNADDSAATPTPTEVPKDLGGIEILVGDWWTNAEAEPADQQEIDTKAYQQQIQEKYNFKLVRDAICGWGEMQELSLSSMMAGDPAADIFFLGWGWVAAPLQQNLLYPLNTLEDFDFSEEKWIADITEVMTFDGNIYGMAYGQREPKTGVFFNKRLLEEAGLSPELPYDLQASGEWTWEKFEEIVAACTRDVNNDGTPDVYGMASFSADLFPASVYSNGGNFIGKDENGKFYNRTGEANFLEAFNWVKSLQEKGYQMPTPEGANWDWFYAAFIEGKVAIQVSEQYRVGALASMVDDWGFVIFPKGPQGEMMTILYDNIQVMPGSFDQEKANKIAFAWDKWTDPTPGYEDTDWRTPYYKSFRDTRAVDETLPLFYTEGHYTQPLHSLVAGIDLGADMIWSVDGGNVTPAEAVETVQEQWKAFIDAANGVTE